MKRLTLITIPLLLLPQCGMMTSNAISETDKKEMEPHGLTAVVPTIVRRDPPKHFKNLPTAGPSDAFIPGLTPEVFCVGG